ncbi:MAG: hypothetical protein LUG88_05330 [Clostridia bacterium]|nr:hypothetical protein [Clostridia bacterium]
MNKVFNLSILLLAVVLITSGLVGCAHDINWVISNEPNFWGTVDEITDDYVVVNVNSDEEIYTSYTTIYVSTDVEFTDISSSGLEAGDEIAVHYDGTISEEDGQAYVHGVYGFCLITPINREKNNVG